MPRCSTGTWSGSTATIAASIALKNSCARHQPISTTQTPGAKATTRMPKDPPARPTIIQGRRIPHRDVVRSLNRPKKGFATRATSDPVAATTDRLEAARSVPTRELTLSAKRHQEGSDEDETRRQIGRCVKGDEHPADLPPGPWARVGSGVRRSTVSQRSCTPVKRTPSLLPGEASSRPDSRVCGDRVTPGDHPVRSQSGLWRVRDVKGCIDGHLRRCAFSPGLWRSWRAADRECRRVTEADGDGLLRPPGALPGTSRTSVYGEGWWRLAPDVVRGEALPGSRRLLRSSRLPGCRRGTGCRSGVSPVSVVSVPRGSPWGSSTLMRGSSRSSQRGSHQLRSPRSSMVAGTMGSARACSA